MYEILRNLPLDDMKAANDWGMCFTPEAKLERRGSPLERYYVVHAIGVAKALRVSVNGCNIPHPALRRDPMVEDD